LIKATFQDLVLMRGWDLGASFAGARRSEGFDIWPLLRTMLARGAPTISEPTRERLARSILDLVQYPETEEAKILVNLGRLAFGVDLALERPRGAFVYETVLPQVVYLDASVVLPALADGHPYRSAYRQAIAKLRRAAERAGLGIRICILDVFLNEILSHKGNAVRTVEEEGLEDPITLRKYVEYAGLDKVNVFLTSYATALARQKDALKFREFLQASAPYKTEGELSSFLLREGIETSKSRPRGVEEQTTFSRVLSALTLAYHADAVGAYDRKLPVLIEHEASQLARIGTEQGRGTRSIFVTADSRLRRLAVGENLGGMGSALISHVGMLQLIDLLVGLEGDAESLARLLWAVDAWDEKAVLRSYFVDRALSQYDAATARAMTGMLDDLVEEVLSAARTERMNIHPYQLQRGGGERIRFLDRFENRFFEKMAQEIRRLEDS
jgi:hypothetical protein